MDIVLWKNYQREIRTGMQINVALEKITKDFLPIRFLDFDRYFLPSEHEREV